MQLSEVVRKLKPSATIAAAEKARQLKNQGVRVYDFTLGEPDFDTPAHIRQAAVEAMQAGHTHYTPASGIAELKQAICNAFQRDHGVHYEPSAVVVSNGAKHAIHNVLTALCGPGDEVIIPAPYWVSYSALVELVGATPVIVPTREEDGFCLDADDFTRAVTPRTRMLLLNNPCNPTGAAYPIDKLERLASEAATRNVVILADEIYEKLIYEGSTFRSVASLSETIRAQTVVVNGVSKAYAMTGWRIGWALAPQEVAQAMSKLQGQQTSNPCSISQYAALAALNGPQDCVEAMRQEFALRRELVLERLRRLPDVSFAEPGGAFYAFFHVGRHFGRPLAGGPAVETSTEFCTALLEKAHVALVTGDAFGAPGYVRLSFATDRATLEAGLDRLEAFLTG